MSSREETALVVARAPTGISLQPRPEIARELTTTAQNNAAVVEFMNALGVAAVEMDADDVSVDAEISPSGMKLKFRAYRRAGSNAK